SAAGALVTRCPTGRRATGAVQRLSRGPHQRTRRRPVGRPLAPSSPWRPNDALAAGIARSSAGFSNRSFTRLTESGTHYRMSSGRFEKPAEGLGRKISMGTRKLSLAALVLSAMAALLSANLQSTTPSGIAMTKAAKEYLGKLTNDQRKQTSFAFDDKERLNWHFIPRPRNGLPVKQLEGDALKSAHALIRSGLSEAGYDQALNVMSLEEVLYLLEGGDREERRAKRDPQKYYVSIFGTPAETGTWG